MQEERSKEKQLVPSGSRGSFLGIVVCEWVARNARQLRAQTGKGCAWHRLLLRWSGAGRSPVAASRGAAGGSTSRQRAWEQLHSGAHRLGGGDAHTAGGTGQEGQRLWAKLSVYPTPSRKPLQPGGQSILLSTPVPAGSSPGSRCVRHPAGFRHARTPARGQKPTPAELWLPTELAQQWWPAWGWGGRPSLLPLPGWVPAQQWRSAP